MANTNQVLQKYHGQKPEAFNRRASAAIKPGTICYVNSSNQYAKAGTGNAKDLLYIAAEQQYLGADVDDAWTSGDSTIAFEIRPERTFLARMAAGTYGVNAKLTVNANGQFAAAGADDEVIGYHDSATSETATADSRLFVRT